MRRGPPCCVPKNCQPGVVGKVISASGGWVAGGVVTGRWASRGGGALQLPQQIRSAVRAEPGWRLVVADADSGLSRDVQAVAMIPGTGEYSLATSQVSHDLGLGETGPWTGKAGRAVGRELKDVMGDVNRLLNVLVITDDDVEAQRRIILRR